MKIIQEMFVDQLSVRAFDTRTDMGECAGTEAAEAIRRVIAEKGVANVMFAAAPSQNETLETLVNAEGIDWSKVNAFHMDEYVGLEAAHPAGFRNFLKRAIFDKKNCRSVNLLNGNAENPFEEAMRYERILRDNPLDVCLCGVGENGHIAFNDPPVADFRDPRLVKVVELEDVCRLQQVHDGCFQHIGQVPTHALTVTIPGMTGAKAMYCTVPAATKAQAVYHMLRDAISEKCPATILRKHPNAKLYLDRDSAQLIL